MADSEWAELIARERIRDVLHLYCHATDRADHTQLAACFHPDAELDFGYFHGGPKDLIAFSEGFLAKFSGTHHSLSNIVIRVDGDRAETLSHITAVHSQWKRRSGVFDMIGWGRYVDRFEKRDDAWRIAHRKVMFDWTIELPSGFEWPESLLPFAGRRDRDDPSYRIFPPLRP
jgi:ketosteroid isomerase-like protein